MKELLFQVGLWWALLWPLGLALRVPMCGVLVSSCGSRPLLDGLWCTAPLPALALAMLGPSGALTLDWWMLGGHWKLDELRRPLLAFAALLWGLAGCYARGYLAAEQSWLDAGDRKAGGRLQRLALLWPLTLAGNLLLILAEDIASFYLGFAVMTFAAYGLVVHTGSRDARIGGLAYLVMAVLGEGLILSGLLWAAGSSETTTLEGLRQGIARAEQGGWMGLLLWLGFGVKAGVVGLHLWLPLAHPVAPTPASAVLSGVMIKAGLLGWLVTLPLGHPEAGEAFRLFGRVMLAAGLAAALGAALYGMCQRLPKAVLAYSSISQMGMITSLVAMGLVAPELWPSLLPVVLLFAAHHGLTKGALFLGVGIGEHPPRLPAWLLWSLLALPALSLCGGLASGLATKWAFKSTLYDAGHSGLVFWLGLAAVGTTLLMARTLWCQWRDKAQARDDGRTPLIRPMPLAWLATLVAALSVPWWLPSSRPEWPPAEELTGLMWPLALGVGLSVVAWGVSRHRSWRLAWRPPPGDLWWPFANACRGVDHAVHRPLTWLGEATARARAHLEEVEQRLIDGITVMTRGEPWLGRHGSLLMMGIAVLLAMVLWWFP